MFASPDKNAGKFKNQSRFRSPPADGYPDFLVIVRLRCPSGRFHLAEVRVEHLKLREARDGPEALIYRRLDAALGKAGCERPKLQIRNTENDECSRLVDAILSGTSVKRAAVSGLSDEHLRKEWRGSESAANIAEKTNVESFQENFD